MLDLQVFYWGVEAVGVCFCLACLVKGEYCLWARFVAVGEVDEHWHLVIAGDKEGAGPRLCEWTAWEGKQVASWDSHCLVELPVHCLVEAGEV